MIKHIRAGLSFANVMSVIALFVALSGAAYAGGLMTGKDIKDNSIKGRDIDEKTLKHISRCPTVTPTEVGSDLCISGPHIGTDWDTAVQACANSGARLPSVGELMQAAVLVQLVPTWTSDTGGTAKPSSTTDAASVAKALSASADQRVVIQSKDLKKAAYSTAAKTAQNDYRCVTNRTV
jgi:hypothetical protein